MLTSLFLSISRNKVKIIFTCILVFTLHASGQFEKNQVLPINEEGYVMILEKLVRIPDDGSNRPRINSFTYYGDRLFTGVEQGGKIYEITDDGTGGHEAVVFLDLTTAIPLNTGRNLNVSGNWHTGLRSIAFHPEFETNGKFYTSAMEERPDDTTGHHYLSDDPDAIEADGILIEWTYDHEAGEVDVNSYREVFRTGMPVFDHTIKQIKFNRYAEPGDEDYGLLYVTHGDGSVQSATTGGGQRNDALGKIIRIDPLQQGDAPYGIPSTNPYVGDTAWMDELYAVGFRNPHTLCFGQDDNDSTFLIVGNAGRDNIEEVELVFAGENYGWSEREGTFVHLEQGGILTGIEAMPDNEAELGYTYPAAQWAHNGAPGQGFVGLAIAGGYVYTMPESGEKIYLSSDFAVTGRIFHNNLDELTSAVIHLDPEDPDRDEPEELTQAEFHLFSLMFDHDNDPETPPQAKSGIKDILNDESSYDGSDRADLRFGQDADENIYILNKRNGWIYKVQTILEEPPVIDGLAYAVHALNDAWVYPNPVTADGQTSLDFNHSLESDVQIWLVNTLGQEFYIGLATTGSERIRLDLSEYSGKTGQYYLKLVSSEGFKILKVQIR